MNYCTNCGAPLQEGTRFCTGCGQPVAQPSQPHQQQNPNAQGTYNPNMNRPNTGYQAGTVPPKKNKSLGKTLLIVVLAIVVIVGAWSYIEYSKEKKEYEQGLTQTSEGNNYRTKTISGKEYKLEIPENARKVKCKEVTDEEMSELSKIGNIQFLARPIDVTQKGENHVQFDQMARVSFDIPKDIPKEKWMNLMGVLFMDDSPVYMIPDYEGLQNGVITFETSHFCSTGVGLIPDEDVRNAIKERWAAGDFYASMSEKDFQKNARETLKEVASTLNFGDDDLMGMVMQEVLADNEIVKKVSDAVTVYDNWGTEEAEEIITKHIEKAALNKLTEKLKKGIKKDKVEYDELHDKYVHTWVTEDKPMKKYVEKFEKHLTQENMEKIGTELGGGDPESYARKLLEYAKGQCQENLKEMSKKIIPGIDQIQTAAAVMRGIKKFWASNEMADMYATYKKYADGNGRMSKDDWNALMIRRANAAKSKFGMSEEEIRQQFFERFQNEKEIQQRKDEIEKDLRFWEKGGAYSLINKRIFDEKKWDYVQRVNRLAMLSDWFEGELFEYGIVNDGTAPGTIRSLLEDILNAYLDNYPNHAKFYKWYEKWLADQGYKGKKISKDYYWVLVDTQVEKAKDTKSDYGYVDYKGDYIDDDYMSFTATENELSMRGKNAGLNSNSDKVQQAVGLTAKIQTPPAWMKGGDTLVLHCTLKRTTSKAYCFIKPSLLLYFEPFRNGCQAPATDVQGSTDIWTQSEHDEGEWNYKLRIPMGREGAEKVLKFDACGSSIRWIYRWSKISEEDELL